MTVRETQVRELTQAEGQALLDREAKRTLGISGEEFIRRYEAGEFNAQAERREIVHLAMLLPLAR